MQVVRRRVRWNHIKSRAAEILKKYPALTTPSVDIARIAMMEGIVVQYRTLDVESLSGFFSRADMMIGINVSHPLVRQRFTIAHELGHYLLHDDDYHIDQTGGYSFRNSLSSEGIDVDEIEANQFAAEVLMPEKSLLEAVGLYLESHVPEELVSRLAEDFKVSVQAMTIRLNGLRLLV